MTYSLGNKHLLLLLALVVAAGSYLLSNWLLDLYTAGDQRHYIRMYEAMQRVPFTYFRDVQYNYTGSREPLYGALIWILAPVVEKNVLISIANSALAVSILIFLLRNGAHPAFIILSASNFYLLVLLTSAERLKLAYLFAVLAAILPSAWRGVVLLAALLNHFSILIVFLALLLPQKLREAARSFRVGGSEAVKNSLIFASIALFSVAFSFVYRNALTEKLASYISNDPGGILPATILLIVAVFISEDRIRMAAAMTFSVVATFILGPERVNMLSVTIFLYIVVREGKTGNPAVLAIMLYLTYKSIEFLQNVFKFGTGFAA